MNLNMRIGIIMGRIYKETNRRTLQGILEQAYSLGMSAAVFTLIQENNDEQSLHGEENLLTLINFSLIDGIIYVPYSFSTDRSQERIEEFLRKNCTVPIITLANDKSNENALWYDDRAEIAEITTHLINEHNCRKIYCLTGSYDNHVSHSRLEGYKDAMTAANLPFSDDDIIFGDFWYHSGRRLAEEIAEGKREIPDAVVCANDSMAVALCDELIARGISVPSKIRITGYDGTLEASFHSPSITTYKTAWTQLGRNAMCRLYYLISGNECKSCKIEHGTIDFRESCGCKVIRRENSFDFDYQTMEDNYLDSNLSTLLLSADSLSSFASILVKLTFVFMSHVYYEHESYCLCLCEDWDEVRVNDGVEEYRRDGYSEKMLFANILEKRVTFNSKDMYPPNHLKPGIPSVTFFTAVHFQDRCFGYALLTIDNDDDGINHQFLRFCREVNNGLEFLRVQNKLKSLAYKQYVSGLRDELTGLYNGDYFTQLWTEAADKASLFGQNVFTVGISLKGLYQINEAFGSVEKDKLIIAFSSLIPGCCIKDEKCVRANESQFIIIGVENSGSNRHEVFINSLNERLEQHNRSSGTPYRIQIKSVVKVMPCTALPPADKIMSEITELLRAEEKHRYSYSEQIYYSALVTLREQIYRHPERDWSLNMCCQKLDMSVSNFQRIYRKTFGASCMHDVQQSKLSYAKKLLLNSTDTLQVIAHKCGYDYSHFMRSFKKETGMTPTEYRSGKGAEI